MYRFKEYNLWLSNQKILQRIKAVDLERRNHTIFKRKRSIFWGKTILQRPKFWQKADDKYFAKCIYLGDLLTLIFINECRRSYPTRLGSKADDLFSNDCGFLIGSPPLTQMIICFHIGSSALTQGLSTCILFRIFFKEVRFGLYFYLGLLLKSLNFENKKYQNRTLFDESTQNFSYRQILTVKIVKIRQIYLKPKAKCITWFTSLKTTFLDN